MNASFQPAMPESDFCRSAFHDVCRHIAQSSKTIIHLRELNGAAAQAVRISDERRVVLFNNAADLTIRLGMESTHVADIEWFAEEVQGIFGPAAPYSMTDLQEILQDCLDNFPKIKL